jgi:DNA-binding LytR/AlgR family response regulator
MMFYPFFIWHKKKLVKIFPETVLLLETWGNYTKIFLSNDQNYLIRSSLSTTLKNLPQEIFIQVHRNYIVSILFIDNITTEDLVIGETPIPIGKNFYKPLMEKLNVIK